MTNDDVLTLMREVFSGNVLLEAKQLHQLRKLLEAHAQHLQQRLSIDEPETSMAVDKRLDALWWQHTAPGDNEWDNWRRFGRAVLAEERASLLKLCALQGMTVADIARIIQERTHR